MIACSLHVSPEDFLAVTVGDSNWEGRRGRGFHKLVTQPKFWDIFYL
jgi:hypothetical protein